MSNEKMSAQTAAALYGVVTDKSLPVEDRLQIALQVLEHYSPHRSRVVNFGTRAVAESKEVLDRLAEDDTVPPAWSSLIEGLLLLSKGHNSRFYPLQCEYDVLTVCADPEKFTTEEISRLFDLGFFVKDGAFKLFILGGSST